MTWVGVFFGWPAILCGLVALYTGAASRRRGLMFLGLILLAAPTLYLAGTPRFGVAAPVTGILLVAAVALARRQPRAMWACVAASSALYVAVAWAVVTAG